MRHPHVMQQLELQQAELALTQRPQAVFLVPGQRLDCCVKSAVPVLHLRGHPDNATNSKPSTDYKLQAEGMHSVQQA